MLRYNGAQIMKAGVPVENFPLPVYNIFLQVECNIFSYTEIFHGVRYADAQFVTYSEEVINGRFTGKNYSAVIKNIDFLLPELFRRYPNHFYKRPEIDFQSMIPGEFEIG